MKLNNAESILIIVESPNKVKTISGILKQAGYPKATVVASVGHIMTLEDGGPAYNSGIYPDKQFYMNLAVASGKKKVVSDITARASKADKIFIMTDGDREGEIIAWSLKKFCKLPDDKCYRAIAHEITPKAIINALENPSVLNDNLVAAGLSRMMIDKLIGYGLSPLGKKYIGAKSIGRCQSVGLKLISDREAEINEFIPELYFNLYLNFIKNDKQFKAKYSGYNEEQIDKLTKQVDVDAIINDCKNTPYTIEDCTTINHTESPKPPFCTATFQQEAATKLNLRVKDAMSYAQKLFEGVNINGNHIGLITYMRTDSTELAEEFIPELANFIKMTYGADKYNKPRKGKQKSTDQNGHEALRVVDVTMTPEKLAGYINNPLILKVYKLIWQRTVAAAMPNAIIEETIYTINNNGHKFKLSSKTIRSPGYRLVYAADEASEPTNTETFSIGETLNDTKLEAVKKFTQPKPRYSEASLVKELQQREIGRPSTYALIVETILNINRGYAKLEEKCIVPTDRGIQLAKYCDRAFPNLINLNYTKEMELGLDKIATGKILWLDYMDAFYKNLKATIENTQETGMDVSNVKKKCPKCGEPMVVRRSKFGKLFYGCSTYPKCTGITNLD